MMMPIIPTQMTLSAIRLQNSHMSRDVRTVKGKGAGFGNVGFTHETLLLLSILGYSRHIDIYRRKSKGG